MRNSVVVPVRFSVASPSPGDFFIAFDVSDAEPRPTSLPTRLPLSPLGAGRYSASQTIRGSVGQCLFFQFIYPGSNPSRIGQYSLLKSLPEPVLISDIDETPSRPQVIFRFKLNYHTFYGQMIRVVGSLPGLGHWHVANGFALNHSGSTKRDPATGSFTDPNYNWQGDLVLPRVPDCISYRYVVANECAEPLLEPGGVRLLAFSHGDHSTLSEFNDLWRLNDMVQTVFTKRLFEGTLFQEKNLSPPVIGAPIENSIRCVFCAHCGMVGRVRNLVVVGSIPELGQWNPARGLHLEPAADLQWSAQVSIPRDHFPFEFKVVAVGGADSLVWETGENRKASLSSISQTQTVTIDCWHLSFTDLSFHSAGVQIDVNAFDSFDFGDLAAVIEWSKRVGFTAIHLVGIFDNSGMSPRFERLPVSAFAINPILADLTAFGFAKSGAPRAAVLEQKLAILRGAWDNRRPEEAAAVAKFRAEVPDLDWLTVYERVCYGRSKGVDYLDEVDREYAGFVDFVQFYCYRCLRRAIDAAKGAQIAIAIDVPFALSERSGEAFGHRELFLMDYKLGVEPSMENPIGEILPAYPYSYETAVEFFRARISYFSGLFTILRLESTIRYFRQWIVPRDAVRAVFGQFKPSVNLSYAELEISGLWDIDRYTQAFITRADIAKIFGDDAGRIADFFFTASARDLAFKAEFATERLLVSAELPPDAAALRDRYLDELLRLQAEVLLIRASDSEYRPRPVLSVAPHAAPGAQSFSFAGLPSYHQSPFLRLEEEFMGSRQRCVWTANARSVLATIVSACDATFFSDASGRWGDLCNETLQSVDIMPLRVQLEGGGGARFDDIRGYPYLSVASPQRDLRVPLRVLWGKEREQAGRLWREEFWESGDPPPEFNDVVANAIIKQHCWCGSMWVMFPIDLLVGASQYIVHSDNLEYGALDLERFFADERSVAEIGKLLAQAKRK
jgi:hypothetical protein